MTAQEIFSGLSQHMIKGIMTHEQFANYYDFLGLEGYRKCHEYHYLCETAQHRKLNRYYASRYNKLIEEKRVDDPNIIPSSWFKYTRQDVDPTTKSNAVKSGLEAWEKWETDTKALYERMYVEAFGLGEIACAEFIKGLICDVDCELKEVQKYRLDKITTQYSVADIVHEQKEKHEKYKCKIKCIGDKF